MAILVVVALVVVGKGGDYYHVEVEGWHFGFRGEGRGGFWDGWVNNGWFVCERCAGASKKNVTGEFRYFVLLMHVGRE